MIATIAHRELRSLLRSPLAWLLLGFLQLLLAWIFLLQLEGFIAMQSRLATLEGAPGLTDLVASPLLGSAATLFLLLAPLLGMRSLAGERHSGTLRLLLSSPLTARQIVLGKYLGLLGFLLLMTALTLLMPLSLLAGGGLDMGKLAAGVLGLLLAGATFAAITLFISSLTGNPLTAAFGGFGVLLLLWLIGLGGETQDAGVLGWLSLQAHLLGLLRGVVRLSDILYYLILIAAVLTLTIHQLKLQGET